MNVKGALPFDFYLDVIIAKFYHPSTFSVVLEVEILTAVKGPLRAVLKLYDRRFSSQLCHDYKIKACTSAHETAYFDFIRSGGAAEFLEDLHEDDHLKKADEVGDEVQPWDAAQNEAFLYDYCLDSYETEVDMHERLKDHQGAGVPQPLTLVTCMPYESPGGDGLPMELLEVKGVLLELISGFALGELEKNAPKEAWQSICDGAVQLVHTLLHDHEILNEDIRIQNVLISRSRSDIGTEDEEYRVVMLDFANCRFQGSEESDVEWGKVKGLEDEEDAIGRVMQMRLKEVAGFHLDLSELPSGRYEELFVDGPIGDEA